MRYNTIKKNDIANAPGVCVSVYLQGCPHHCPKCFNPETWDPKGGKEFDANALDEILNSINVNGIERNLCLLGGEPLWTENLDTTILIAAAAKKKYPNIKIYLWTGYIYEQIKDIPIVKEALKFVDVLIDGPYIDSQRDLTLEMRGSKNQRIIYLKGEKG